STLAPEATLTGKALIAEAVGPEDAAETDRQFDLTFANGANHRVVFTLKDGKELRVRVDSALPGAALQTLELVLTKSKRETL
ncbi:MAG: hypothetical protein Q7J64_06485, partial [Elusimicrobiota bacterium]|nr:hypothetical protein [Elusimicrobiota bacterium]